MKERRLCLLECYVPIQQRATYWNHVEILAEKAFTENWFNETHSLDVSNPNLVDLLRLATNDQLF